MDSDNYLMANHYYLYLVIVMHAYSEDTASTQVLRYQRDKLKLQSEGQTPQLQNKRDNKKQRKDPQNTT